MSYEYERTVWSNEETSLSADHFNNMEEGIVHALTPATSEENGAMSAEDKAKIDNLVDLIYPVGSVYMSVNSADPATLFGGLWRKIEGRFLLGSSSGYELGATGGSADAVVPYHRHSVPAVATTGGDVQSKTLDETSAGDFYYGSQTADSSGIIRTSISSKRQYDQAGTSANAWVRLRIVATHDHGFTNPTTPAHNTNYAGTSGNLTNANMPPYLVVNVWERYA